MCVCVWGCSLCPSFVSGSISSCVFLWEFFFFADLQVLCCAALVCVCECAGARAFSCIFVLYVCLCVCVCLCLSWIAVEICELSVQSFFVSFSLSLSTYILESLVLLKNLWCFGTVTFFGNDFLVLAIGKEGVYVFFERE